jgi:hypothetical protein
LAAPERLLQQVDIRGRDALEAEIGPLPRLGRDRGDARAVEPQLVELPLE